MSLPIIYSQYEETLAKCQRLEALAERQAGEIAELREELALSRAELRRTQAEFEDYLRLQFGPIAGEGESLTERSLSVIIRALKIK